MDQSKESLIKSKKISTEELIKLDLKNEPKENTSKPGFIQRKSKRIKKAFSGFLVVGKTGLLIGGIVGCSMGFLYGCVAAYQSKTLIVIPLSMATSGFFFASLMSIGAILRNEDMSFYENNQSNQSNQLIYMNIYSYIRYDESKNEYVMINSNIRRI